MKNFVWVGLCIIAIGISLTLGGLIADKEQPEDSPAINTPPSALIHGVELQPIRAIVSHTSSASSSASIVLTRTNTSEAATSSAGSHTQPRTPTQSSLKAAHSSTGTNSSRELDPELIDRLIPAPFNQIVKEQLVGEGDKERFKKFALADTKDEWSLSMEHHLYDGIISHPLANLITIQSISCKSGVCELQIYEQQNDTWNQVIADLANQPWWDFESFSTYTFIAMVDLRRRNANYVLLGKTQ